MRRLSDRLFSTSAFFLVVLATTSLPRPVFAQSATEVAAVGPYTAGVATLIRTNATVIGIDVTGDSVSAEFVTATAVKVTRGKEPLN
jgi:hypothetical protein